MFDVELVTITFGVGDGWREAERISTILGLPHRVIKMKKEVLDSAVMMCIEDGNPRRAINYLHKQALEMVATQFPIIADGTRRDDRVPMLSLSETRSLEDKYGIEYVRPLLGYGRKTLNRFVHALFEIEEKESEELRKADYEEELRILLGSKSEEIFPQRHIQSKVLAMK